MCQICAYNFLIKNNLFLIDITIKIIKKYFHLTKDNLPDCVYIIIIETDYKLLKI